MKKWYAYIFPVLLWIIYSAQADIYTNEQYIYDVVPDYRIFYHEVPTGNASRLQMHIPDITENQTQTLDMIKTNLLRDDKGNKKYHIKSGAVEAVPKWEPVNENPTPIDRISHDK